MVGEGQTEQKFVSEVLGPTLADRELRLEPRLIPTSRTSRGGALSTDRVLRFLRNTLLQRREVYVTTLFDLYRLPVDFPGSAQAAGIADPVERATAIEIGFAAAVVAQAECEPYRFIPHIQPYEFESLLFSDLTWLPDLEPAWAPFVSRLQRLTAAAASPEHINSGSDTHPSARLTRLLRPRYQKVRHGPTAAQSIGVARIREQCVHFSTWVARIESLRPLSAHA